MSEFKKVYERLDSYIEFAEKTKKFSDVGFYTRTKDHILGLESTIAAMKQAIIELHQSNERKEWVSGLPSEVGHYWLYSYRYGRKAGIYDHKKELTLVEVIQISNGTLIKGDGQFVSAKEVEDPFYIPADMPALPEAPR